MLDKFYKEIDSTDRNTLFTYFIIIIVCIFIARLINIDNSVFLTLFVGILIIFYMNYKKQDKKEEIETIMKKKNKKIRPQGEIINKYDTIIDFLFSIQDMYIYNPPAYEELVDNIEEFLKYYEDSKRFPENAGNNYGLLESKKNKSVNALHSIIYNIPSNKYYINKLERGMEKINDILEIYMEEVYKINDVYIKEHGYNNRSVIIMKGPKANNFYEKEDYTYEII
jgi:hypothetical protein